MIVHSISGTRASGFWFRDLVVNAWAEPESGVKQEAGPDSEAVSGCLEGTEESGGDEENA